MERPPILWAAFFSYQVEPSLEQEEVVARIVRKAFEAPAFQLFQILDLR